MSLHPVEGDDKKRKKAMQNRLKKLGADNPVVKQAIKKNEPRRDAYEDFEIVHELVAAAYSGYAEGGGSLKESVANLGTAISKAAGNLKGKVEGEEDYDNLR